MSQIPRTFINEVIERCDIVALVKTRVSLQKRGANFLACCPFHSEKTPSFTVSPIKQLYHCFGCGVSGNALTFLMEFERMDFREAIATLAAQTGLELPKQEGQQQSAQPEKQADFYKVLGHVSQYYQDQLNQNQKGLAYLAARGIDLTMAKEYALGFAPAAWNNVQNLIASKKATADQLIATGVLIKKTVGKFYDRFRNRLMFPIRDSRGRIIGFGGRTLENEEPKYLNSPETVIFHKSSELYGLFEALPYLRKDPYLVIVEGYMDVLALVQHGIRNTAATLGTATTSEHLRKIFRYTSTIIFCFDGDEAGKKAAWRALENALPQLHDGRQIKFVFLPDAEDPDSLIRKEGADAFKTRIAQANSFSDFFFKHLSQQGDRSKLEEKAHMFEIAMNSIQKLPQGPLQQMMQDQLARVLHLNPEKMSSYQAEASTGGEQKGVTLEARSAKRNVSPLRIALALLLQNPTLIKYVDSEEQLISLKLPGTPLFLSLIQLLKQESKLTTPAILEYWRGTKDHQNLLKLALWEHLVPQSGIEAEFQGALQRLKNIYREQIMEQLLQKATQIGLSSEEKIYLYELIASRHDKSSQSG